VQQIGATNSHKALRNEVDTESDREPFPGSIFSADIRISDHSGPLRTATFRGIARYLQAQGLAREMFTARVD